MTTALLSRQEIIKRCLEVQCCWTETERASRKQRRDRRPYVPVKTYTRPVELPRTAVSEHLGYVSYA